MVAHPDRRRTAADETHFCLGALQVLGCIVTRTGYSDVLRPDLAACIVQAPGTTDVYLEGVGVQYAHLQVACTGNRYGESLDF